MNTGRNQMMAAVRKSEQRSRDKQLKRQQREALQSKTDPKMTMMMQKKGFTFHG